MAMRRITREDHGLSPEDWSAEATRDIDEVSRGSRTPSGSEAGSRSGSGTTHTTPQHINQSTNASSESVGVRYSPIPRPSVPRSVRRSANSSQENLPDPPAVAYGSSSARLAYTAAHIRAAAASTARARIPPQGQIAPQGQRPSQTQRLPQLRRLPQAQRSNAGPSNRHLPGGLRTGRPIQRDVIREESEDDGTGLHNFVNPVPNSRRMPMHVFMANLIVNEQERVRERERLFEEEMRWRAEVERRRREGERRGPDAERWERYERQQAEEFRLRPARPAPRAPAAVFVLPSGEKKYAYEATPSTATVTPRTGESSQPSPAVSSATPYSPSQEGAPFSASESHRPGHAIRQTAQEEDDRIEPIKEESDVSAYPEEDASTVTPGKGKARKGSLEDEDDAIEPIEDEPSSSREDEFSDELVKRQCQPHEPFPGESVAVHEDYSAEDPEDPNYLPPDYLAVKREDPKLTAPPEETTEPSGPIRDAPTLQSTAGEDLTPHHSPVLSHRRRRSLSSIDELPEQEETLGRNFDGTQRAGESIEGSWTVSESAVGRSSSTGTNRLKTTWPTL